MSPERRDNKQFRPHRWLGPPDLMMLAAAVLPRRFPRLPAATERLFEVPGAGTGERCARILAKCHWRPEPKRAPTLVAVHGLEGSADSAYLCGLAERAFVNGFNAIRLNQRNCGGTEKLTSTLYNSGLSGDLSAVLEELTAHDGLSEIFFAGFSMGGNLVLKMAGELGATAPPALRGVCAICPSADLQACVARTEQRRNVFYQWYFVSRLKRRMRTKIRLYPNIYQADGMRRVRTIRQFDDLFTAPHCGYASAADYYHRASALRVLPQIRVPTLLIYANDDPLVPASTAENAAIRNNPKIRVLRQEHGSHCAFISADPAERYWAEARVVEFCSEQLSIR